ncbi:MAG: ABC transporter permease [Candidatus Bipolaricaulota bacterium]|nr:ABC transporter permease [Candidatus Bipolaricaulota bacterium]
MTETRIGEVRRLWRTFCRNKTAFAGAVIALIVILVAILAPVIAPYDPLIQDVYHRLLSPQQGHLLGTDNFGRDILSRVIYGARVSLIVGISSVLIGMVIGTSLGIIAGIKGGTVENVIMRTVDVLMSFPNLIMGLMVMAVLGSGMIKLIIAIGVIMAPRFVRIVHAPTLAIKEQDYITAARALGFSDLRVIFRHALPNVMGEVLVMATLWTATAIRIEANLSFIGLGVPPPTPTWGGIIREGMDYLTNASWISLFSGAAILITVLSFNMLGDGIRDIIDPRTTHGR